MGDLSTPAVFVSSTPPTIGPLVFTRAGLRAAGIPFTNPTLLRMEREGRFPKRFYLSEKRPVWFVDDVKKWLTERQSASEPNAVTAPAACGRMSRHKEVNA